MDSRSRNGIVRKVGMLRREEIVFASMPKLVLSGDEGLKIPTKYPF